MIMLYPITDEAKFASDFPEALSYARAVAIAAAPERRPTFKSGSIKGRVAFIIFNDDGKEIKVRVEKQGDKYTITKYMDGPVNETKALQETVG